MAKVNQSCAGCGVQVITITDHHDSYYTGAERDSGYTTSCAATTGPMERVSICLWVTSQR